LAVSRSGFHAWLGRPASARAIQDAKLVTAIDRSFKASDRTYGARRVWRDVLEEGLACGLHRVERLTRQNSRNTDRIGPDGPRRLGNRQLYGEHVCQGAGHAQTGRLLLRPLAGFCAAIDIYRTRDEARADVFDYIERFYNPRRRHSKLDYLSPMAFEDRAMPP
jgi:putative transposase